MSQCPFVQSRKTYPIGHPEISEKDFEPIKSYFGVIKCTVLPPRKLLHPLIPFKKMRGKRVMTSSQLSTPNENVFNLPTLDASAWLTF